MPINLANVSCRDIDTEEETVSIDAGDNGSASGLLSTRSVPSDCVGDLAGEGFLPGGRWLRSGRKLEPSVVGCAYCKAGKATALRFLRELERDKWAC